MEVLSCADCDETLGYSLSGEAAGPVAVAVGHPTLIAALIDRLSVLPTLPWMRGKLVLMHQDAFEGHRLSGIKEAFADSLFDQAILLPYSADVPDVAIEEAYWTTLRMAQQLGMIAGRGVPRRMPMLRCHAG